MMQPSMWTAMAHEEDLPGALRYLYGHGWRWFELSDEHLRWIHENDGVDAALAVLEELDVKMPQAHALLSADVLADPSMVERLMLDLDVCAKVGVKNVVIHPGTGPGYVTTEERAEQMQVNVQAFARLGNHAGELGLRIGIENLMDMYGPPGRKLFGSQPDDLLELIDVIGLPSIGVTIDTSHANVQKLDIPAAVRAFGDRIYCTHISANDGSGDQHLIPGQGRLRVIDWRAVMRAFGDIGYDGVFNLEIPGARDPAPELLAHNTSYALAVTETLIAMADGR